MADVDAKLVEKIAAQVMAAMQGSGAPEAPVSVHAPMGTCTGDYSKFPELAGKRNEDHTKTANAERRTPNDEKERTAPTGSALRGMITAAQLRALKGVARLAADAKLTPLAADYVKAGRIQIVREGDSHGAGAPRAVKQPQGKPLPSVSTTTPRQPEMKQEYGMQNMFQLKQEMCEVGHRIWMKGFCAGNEGNHSVRIANDRVLCTPTGLSKGFLRPEMITVVDMEGNQVDKDNKYKRTSEILLHLQIYKKRPDVKAVIHSHPPHATAFACAGVPIPEGVHPEAEVFLGKVPTAQYTTPSYKELGESVTKLITPETNTVLLGNHGTVSFSTSLMETYYKLEIIDAYCRILLLIKQIGRVNVLSQQEMIELLKVKEKFGIPDARLKCAPTGCIGTDNQPFLSTFPEATVASASCDCETGNIVQSGGGLDETAFETMVQQVTDQIMAAAR